MISDSNAFEAESAAPIFDINESEIGCAAADVDDEDAVAGAYDLAPVGVFRQPGVESGLWLFEQYNILEAGFMGGALGKLASNGIEIAARGCGNTGLDSAVARDCSLAIRVGEGAIFFPESPTSGIR